ncbi:hypothetical protein D3C72_1541270 [compost metagenome]
MHRLKIVVAEHQDHQCQRRVDLDTLRQSLQPVAPGLEGIVPDRAAAVQAVFDDAHRRAAVGIQRQFQAARPAHRKRQPLARAGDDPPGQ